MWRAFKFRHNFFSFLAETSKVPPLCQSRLSNSRGQWLFWLCNPQSMPATSPPPRPPRPPILGENIDRCIEFQFNLKLPLVFPFDYLFWTSLRTRCDSVSPVFSLWQCTKYSTPAIVFVQPLNLLLYPNSRNDHRWLFGRSRPNSTVISQMWQLPLHF